MRQLAATLTIRLRLRSSKICSNRCIPGCRRGAGQAVDEDIDQQLEPRIRVAFGGLVRQLYQIGEAFGGQ